MPKFGAENGGLQSKTGFRTSGKFEVTVLNLRNEVLFDTELTLSKRTTVTF